MFASWFAVRWYVGDTVAEYAAASEQDAIELARLAERWAPADPFTHWQVATLTEKNFSAENLAEAAREYQLSVALSPNDYRYWMEYAGGLRSAGDESGSEQALRRTVELAPAYSQPRWYLGNLLLREGKLDEGFEQVRRAAAADPEMQPQLLNLAWQAFAGDVDQIVKTACPTPDLRARLASYLVGRNKIDDAMRVWNGLSRDDKTTWPELTAVFKQELLKAGQFSHTLSVIHDTEPDPPAAEQIWNGGFERPIAAEPGTPFYWTVASRLQAQIGIDSDHPHGGEHSLRIVFGAPTRLEGVGLSQAVVVSPNAQYHLEYFVRTRDLNSGSTPQVTVVDMVDNTYLGMSAAAPTGTNDWQKTTIDFKTKASTHAIKLMLYRGGCGEAQICPIFGKLWYDDFSVKRGGGPSASR
jgi:tetratricopeptide (TPR) repeat protein